MGAFLDSGAFYALAEDVAGIAGVSRATAVTLTAVGCGGDESSFLSPANLTRINAALAGKSTFGAWRLAVAPAPAQGVLITQLAVVAPYTNAALAPSTLSGGGPALAAQDTAIVNMASRLAVIKGSLDSLTSTVAVWSPVAGYGVDSPACIIAASLPVAGSQLSPPAGPGPSLLWLCLLILLVVPAIMWGMARAAKPVETARLDTDAATATTSVHPMQP